MVNCLRGRSASGADRRKKRNQVMDMYEGKHVAKKSRKAPKMPKLPQKTVLIVLAALIVLVLLVLLLKSSSGKSREEAASSAEEAVSSSVLDFDPTHTEETDPANFIRSTSVQVDDVTLESIEDYTPAGKIEFGSGSDYTSVEGIVTFRGNNYRNAPVYGTADIQEKKLEKAWTFSTGSLSYQDSTWTGSGWVGQPLIVKWPASVKKHMNMEDWAKEDDDLVEVIYATMDGNVYFFDLDSGKQTRDALNLGYSFKGAGALDPRGYPILYLGSGYNSYNGTSHVFVISLIDFEILYEFGANDPFSYRGSLSFFDSSALVDEATDQLIYPGENGILYLIKLNSKWDADAGTISIDPGPVVKWRYESTRSSTASYWLGMEDSAAIIGGHAIFADNGGNLMCLNLNTLELDWVQDTLDDTNCSPVVSVEDGHPYVYISTSFHYGWRSTYEATIPVWKIDAENGEIVWQTDFTCYTEEGVSGGVQSTAALGTGTLDGYLYVTVAKTDTQNHGCLACLDVKTGEIVWQHDAYYTWSSPVCVYDKDGTGYVLYCTYGTTLYMLDGLTGEEVDKFDLKGGVEASPAVYDNTLVVGTRKELIWGIRLT